MNARAFLSSYISIDRLKEIYMALSFGFLDIFAGFVAIFLLPFSKEIPWIFILIPPLLTIRGDLNAIFSGVLTTSLHIGLMKDSFRKNTEEYYALISSIYFLGLVNSFLFAIIIGIFMNDIILFLIIFFIINACFFLASSFSFLMTSSVSFITFKKGYDPDVIVYPVMSTVNDIAIILILIVVIEIMEPANIFKALLVGSAIFVATFILRIYLFQRYRRNLFFQRTLKESYIGIAFSIPVSSLTGIILMELTPLLQYFPEILVIWPALITAVGGTGAIVASVLDTKLYRGDLEAHFTSIMSEYGFPMIIQSLIALATYIVALYLVGSIMVGRVLSGTFINVLFLILISSILSALMVYLSSIIIATYAFQKGLNPDNFTITIITTIADFVTSFMILILSTIYI